MPKVTKEEKENPMKNKAYSQIIFHLAKDPSNSFKLAKIKKIGKTQGIIYRQMKELESQNIILQSKHKPRCFEVNFSRINGLFFMYCINEYKKLDKKFKKRYLENSLLKFFFKKMFIEYLTYEKNITIETIFKYVSTSIAGGIICTVDKDFEKILENFMNIQCDFFSDALNSVGESVSAKCGLPYSMDDLTDTAKTKYIFKKEKGFIK